MGKSQWQCMEELIHIIQQDVIEFPTAYASVSISDTPNTISILDNEFAIYSWIRKIMISTSDSEIYLWTSEISSEHLHYLIQIIHEAPYQKLEHLFPLLSISDDDSF